MTLCSDAWRRPDLPAWGSAPTARFWVALEQPGPWGSRAATTSHLDPAIGAALENACLDAGGRLLLIRHAGREASLPDQGERRLFVAGGDQQHPWLGAATISEPHSRELATLVDRLAEPGWTRQDHPPPWLRRHHPILLICVNGKRDQCCALKGIALASRLSDNPDGDTVWLSSHLGGHRFAPTALSLPMAQALARLDYPTASQALVATLAGRTWAAGPDHDRGLTRLPAHLQAAVAALATRLDAQPGLLGVLGSEQDDTGWLVRLSDPTGGAHLVRVSEVTVDDLPQSCGQDAVPARVWQVSLA